jgi:hypothetical protein
MATLGTRSGRTFPAAVLPMCWPPPIGQRNFVLPCVTRLGFVHPVPNLERCSIQSMREGGHMQPLPALEECTDGASQKYKRPKRTSARCHRLLCRSAGVQLRFGASLAPPASLFVVVQEGLQPETTLSVPGSSGYMLHNPPLEKWRRVDAKDLWATALASRS